MAEVVETVSSSVVDLMHANRTRRGRGALKKTVSGTSQWGWCARTLRSTLQLHVGREIRLTGKGLCLVRRSGAALLGVLELFVFVRPCSCTLDLTSGRSEHSRGQETALLGRARCLHWVWDGWLALTALHIYRQGVQVALAHMQGDMVDNLRLLGGVQLTTAKHLSLHWLRHLCDGGCHSRCPPEIAPQCVQAMHRVQHCTPMPLRRGPLFVPKRAGNCAVQQLTLQSAVSQSTADQLRGVTSAACSVPIACSR